MAKVYVFLAEGFEIVEALAVVDVLRRAGVEVTTVAVTEDPMVMSAQKIGVMADEKLKDSLYEDADVLFLPGGMPGTRYLDANEIVKKAVLNQFEKGRLVAAICAAPSVLGHLHILEGKKATCFPGFEQELFGAEYSGDKVVEDGNVITSKGMGTAVDLGLALVARLVSSKTAEELAKKIQYR